MSSDLNFDISIPTDQDGFVLLRCPLCGEFFKLTPQDIQADDVLEIWCPACGLKSDNYLTEEILELALRMAKNCVNEDLYKQFKNMERKTKGFGLTFKVHNKPSKEYEYPIIPGIDMMEIEDYPCCHRQAKINPAVKLMGGYCPFCGVNHDEN